MGNSCVTSKPPALPGKTHDPAFEWKVYGFSSLIERGAISATSATFHCGGYKWFLQVTPMHKRSGDKVPYVALDLALNRIGFKSGYIMNAVFELSMYNHSNGTHCGHRASYSFSVKNTHSEKIRLIALDELLKSSDFLVDDSCVFAVRILKADVSSPKKNPVGISKKPTTVQNLFLQKKEFIKGTYIWNCDFNSRDLKLPVLSPAFEVGGHKWIINMHPLGDQYSTNSLSLFLHLNDLNELPDPESGMMIELTLSILNQKHEQHYALAGRFVFSNATTSQKVGWGWSNFIPLATLNDLSRGYLVGSTCVLKAEITMIGSSNNG
ncbi:hypothetical protein ACP70R_019126 [Stipagrostis hirtigluma subsp. patula]